MGADIHIYAERKLKDGTWAMCKSYDSMNAKAFDNIDGSAAASTFGGLLFHRARGRNYDFFAALAGVRGNGPEAMGLPEDVSPLVREESDRWDSDGHSHSWYMAEHFVPIFMEHKMSEQERTELVAKKLEAKYHLDITATVLTEYLGLDLPYNKEGDEDYSGIRFVFWFDN